MESQPAELRLDTLFGPCILCKYGGDGREPAVLSSLGLLPEAAAGAGADSRGAAGAAEPGESDSPFRAELASQSEEHKEHGEDLAASGPTEQRCLRLEQRAQRALARRRAAQESAAAAQLEAAMPLLSAQESAASSQESAASAQLEAAKSAASAQESAAAAQRVRCAELALLELHRRRASALARRQAAQEKLAAAEKEAASAQFEKKKKRKPG